MPRSTIAWLKKKIKMKKFLGENFLLDYKTSERLFHEFVKDLPIIDYHSHLSAQLIFDDVCFANITQAWLYGDHYKWRAMRTNGVDEFFCTGNASDEEKFLKWAATVPYTLRNPLYHWTHLELQRYFDVDEPLNEKTAAAIYKHCSAKLNSKEFSVRNLLRKMNVQLVCTTDDPIDTLQHHNKILKDNFEIKILPTFRPDKALQTNNTAVFNNYTDELERISGYKINNYDAYLEALQQRHDYFSTCGCVLSDHGLENLSFIKCSVDESKKIFLKLRGNENVSAEEQVKLKNALLLEMAKMNYAKGWIQQYHIGAIRNNNSRKMLELGIDTGWDSIGNNINANAVSLFLDSLDAENKLTKTILYNLNPADNAMMATMIGNFNDGSIAGKIQWGSGWWFLDQKDGMTNQLNTLSNMSLISRFIGMITDSRSFLSFPRHEYFRRVLCNLFGKEIEKGELPNDISWTGKILQDICYYNIKNYLDLQF